MSSSLASRYAPQKTHPCDVDEARSPWQQSTITAPGRHAGVLCQEEKAHCWWWCPPRPRSEEEHKSKKGNALEYFSYRYKRARHHERCTHSAHAHSPPPPICAVLQSAPTAMRANKRSFVVVVVASVLELELELIKSHMAQKPVLRGEVGLRKPIICHGAQKLPVFVAALKSGDEAEALRLLADDGSLVGLKDTVRNNTHAHAHAQVLGLDETSTSAVCPPLSCARASRDHSWARSTPPRRMARRPSITLQRTVL